MRKNEKKLIVGLVCLALVLVIAVGGTAAYYAMTSGGVTNQFTAGTTGCTLTEKVENNQKTSIQITNSGTAPVYVRIRLVTYWQDANGKPVGKAPAALDPDVAEGWVQYGDAYYYTSPVQGGEAVEFLKSALAMVQEDGCDQVIEVLAESIQASPAEAVQQAWGRTVDDAGRITG